LVSISSLFRLDKNNNGQNYIERLKYENLFRFNLNKSLFPLKNQWERGMRGTEFYLLLEVFRDEKGSGIQDLRLKIENWKV